MKRIEVKVHPRARQNRVQPDPDGGFTVWTTAAPENGRANKAVARALAQFLSIPVSTITLERGETSRKKLYRIDEP